MTVKGESVSSGKRKKTTIAPTKAASTTMTANANLIAVIVLFLTSLLFLLLSLHPTLVFVPSRYRARDFNSNGINSTPVTYEAALSQQKQIQAD